MGWKQYARYMEKLQAIQRARDEVGQYEEYLQDLTTLHRRASDPWNWQGLMAAAPPPEPAPVRAREEAARVALSAYKPTFFAKLMGGHRRERADLEAQVRLAAELDAAESEQRFGVFQSRYAEWDAVRNLAARVLKRDPRGYEDALRRSRCFEHLAPFGTRVATQHFDGDDGVAVVLSVQDHEIVPREELKLTAAGKLSTKNMAAGRYWALYQDHVCSCALRTARELFAVLPLTRAVVNVQVRQVDSATGHPTDTTLLAACFLRDVLLALRFDALDPSDSMKNFPHRMKFRKTSGFEPVEPMSLDERWVTS